MLMRVLLLFSGKCIPTLNGEHNISQDGNNDAGILDKEGTMEVVYEGEKHIYCTLIPWNEIYFIFRCSFLAA